MSDEHKSEPGAQTAQDAQPTVTETIEPVTEVEPETPVPVTPTEPKKAKKSDNKMRTILIDKVVVNIGVGEAGDKLIKAEKVIDLLIHRKSTQTISRTTNRDFGIRKMMPIGCKVTLRGPTAEKFLEEAFWVKDNRMPGYSFDQEGNFSFGIPDYTEFRDMKYDPEIGIFGMDISVTMKRPGYRVGIRKIKRKRIPKKFRITPNEVKQFVKSRFKVEVIE
jgi:large subunit ribosomal protein L5